MSLKARFATALTVLAFAGAVAPAAGATEVSVRVEGATSTLLETEVDTTVHPVDGGDGTGLHPCRGPLGETPGPTVTGALDDAIRAAGLGWRGDWNNSSGDFLVTSVAGEAATSSGPWTILRNGVPIPVGGCSMKVNEGDRVLFARDVVFQTMTLGLSGPAEVQPGRPFDLLVEDERNGGAPVVAAEVGSGGQMATTGADGRATFTLDEPGRYAFKATHPDGIRSNTVEVCVGTAGCETNTGDAVRVLDLTEDSRFMRGATPRSIRGRSRAETVRLALRVKRGKRCLSWNFQKRKAMRRKCGAKPVWFGVPVVEGEWRVATGTLPQGSGRLFAQAEGIPGQKWRDGVNRFDFTVLRKKLNRAALVRRATGFLDRQTRNPVVRSSGLLSGWSGLALGTMGRKSAGRLVSGLTLRSPRRAGDGDLARNLAVLMRIRGRSAGDGVRVRVNAMRRALLSRQLADGSFGADPNLTAMAALALSGDGSAILAVAWLAGIQQESGGFSSSVTGTPDVDTTGLAAWALASQGYEAEARRAAAFVCSTQNPDGGFPASAGGLSNAQSTGLGLVAIHAAGGSKLGPRTADRITPTHYLATMQGGRGAIAYMPGIRTIPVWVTAQALLGLAPAKRLNP